MTSIDDIRTKITNFFRIAFNYYGKEIALQSNQHFGIEQICNEEKEQQGEFGYHIQYGFPQSGCVSMNVSYLKNENAFSIDEVTVFALPIGKEFVVANFAPQMESDELSLRVKSGVDMGTKEHKTLNDIGQNPNAVKMLDVAISDLNQAIELGECRTVVPIGSTLIPVCTCSPLPPERRKKV